jgi:hypothetical protein
MTQSCDCCSHPVSFTVQTLDLPDLSPLVTALEPAGACIGFAVHVQPGLANWVFFPVVFCSEGCAEQRGKTTRSVDDILRRSKVAQ